MLQMLFRVTDEGDVVPLSPRGAGGAERVPDGKTVLTAEDAARISGTPANRLRSMWMSTWSDLLDGEREEIRNEPASAAAAESIPLREPKAMPPIDLLTQTKKDVETVLRRYKCPELNDDDFSVLKQWHKERQIPMWSDMTWYKHLPDEAGKGLKLVIIAKIALLRLLAHRTGQYAGCDDTIFEWLDDDRRTLYQASQTVYRRVNGHRDPYTRSVRWEEYAPRAAGDMSLDMPTDFLGRCAEAAALRRAFPDELNGLYCEEEMVRTIAAKAPLEPASGSETAQTIGGFEPTMEGVTITDDTPQTPRQFELALFDLGLGNPQVRQVAIDRFRAKLHRRVDPTTPAFYAAMIKDVQSNPSFYGIEAVAA